MCPGHDPFSTRFRPGGARIFRSRRRAQAEKRTATAFRRVKIRGAAQNLERYALARLTIRVEGGPTRAIVAIERHILIAEALESNPVDGDGGV